MQYSHHDINDTQHRVRYFFEHEGVRYGVPIITQDARGSVARAEALFAAFVAGDKNVIVDNIDTQMQPLIARGYDAGEAYRAVLRAWSNSDNTPANAV